MGARRGARRRRLGHSLVPPRRHYHALPAQRRRGHGHHTASAILAAEAFAAAADPARFPDQLAYVKPWQAKRLVWNAWRRQGQAPAATEKPISRSTSERTTRCSGELGGDRGRVAHHAQEPGGAIPARRGSLPNEFELVAGEPFSGDLFDGVDLSWKRIPGGEAVARRCPLRWWRTRREPAVAVPALLDAYGALDELERSPWVETKRRELLDAIRLCTGLWLEAAAGSPTAVPGTGIEIKATALNRSNVPLSLVRVELPFTTPLDSDRPDASHPRSGWRPDALATSLEQPAGGHDGRARAAARPSREPAVLAGTPQRAASTGPAQELVGASHSPPALVAPS